MADRSQLLLNWIEDNRNLVELLVYVRPVKSVIEAVEVSKIEKKYFIKTIIMKNKNDAELVALIVPAGTKVDRRSIREGTGPKRWTFASHEDIQDQLGFPAGGVPPVCLPEELKVYVDPRVLKNVSMRSMVVILSSGSEVKPCGRPSNSTSSQIFPASFMRRANSLCVHTGTDVSSVPWKMIVGEFPG